MLAQQFPCEAMTEQSGLHCSVDIKEKTGFYLVKITQLNIILSEKIYKTHEFLSTWSHSHKLESEQSS